MPIPGRRNYASVARIIFGSILFMFVVSAGYVWVVLNQQQTPPTVCLQTTCVVVEVANDQAEYEQGLTYRKELAQNAGMIFVFDKDQDHAFWMKNTGIPLDIIWLDRQRRVVHVVEAEPCTSDPCQTYAPPVVSRYVLEVNKGITAAAGVGLGDEVVFLGNIEK